MPSIEENRHVWEAAYDWPDRGEEWSRPWGGTEALWTRVLYPRLSRLLPPSGERSVRPFTVLEIAPGYGRFTGFLRDLCERLIVVDLSPRCIEACRRRYAEREGIEYRVNDGTSLEMIEDDSIDLVFSFDSLVHADAPVLKAYLAQLRHKLRVGGQGFVHHSNAGAYRALAALTRRVPEPLRRSLVERGVLLNTYAWRSESVSAVGVREWCKWYRLNCLSQELVNWAHGRHLIDCLTTFGRVKTVESTTSVIRNPGFMDEAERCRSSMAGRAVSRARSSTPLRS